MGENLSTSKIIVSSKDKGIFPKKKKMQNTDLTTKSKTEYVCPHCNKRILSAYGYKYHISKDNGIIYIIIQIRANKIFLTLL